MAAAGGTEKDEYAEFILSLPVRDLVAAAGAAYEAERPAVVYTFILKEVGLKERGE